MNRVFFLQFVDFRLQLELVAFLSGYLLLLYILQIQLLVIILLYSIVIEELDL